MIALVRIALSRPYTFVVLALLLLIIGPLAALRTPTDIFPDIRIPVIGVVWQYTGLPPDQMSGRITTPFQRALTTARHGRITTDIAPEPAFYYAEDYHQQYLAKNPGGYCGLGGTGVSCPAGLSR